MTTLGHSASAANLGEKAAPTGFFTQICRGRSRAAYLALLSTLLLLMSCTEGDDRAGSRTAEGSQPAATTAAPNTEATNTSTSNTAPPTTSAPNGTPGCDAPSPELVAGANTRTIQSSDAEREYLLWVPEDHDHRTPAPVVFTFHGRGSNKEQQLAYSGFGPRAQSEGVLVVAPDALGSPMQWSPYGAMNEGEDLVFVDDLLTELGSLTCLDLTRLWSTGMSSGGFMTSVLACERPEVFAAYGPVTFTLFNPGTCDDGPPVPIISFHGTDDAVVPFDGFDGRGIPEIMADWAVRNGCEAEPTEERIGTEVLHRAWTGCSAITELYIVEGGGHTWPGSIELPSLGYTTSDIRATDLLWELFLASSTDG